LEWRDGVLLARTNAALLWSEAGAVRSLKLNDVVDARRKPQTTLALVIHRVDADGVASDAVSVWSSAGLSALTRNDVIIDAAWDRESVLLVRKESRTDLYELMLAHAPEEFGGEALSGDAVRLDMQTKTVRPLAGLESKRVRRLFRANY
jgi:hypothetical protein